jgi:hypothetical protein
MMPMRVNRERLRVYLRLVVFIAVIALQLGFVARAHWSDHKEFGWQMFPEASRWQADVVRVTAGGDRVSLEEEWFGYRWNDMIRGRGLGSPWREHHADAGIDNQLAFFQEAMDWLAANTPRDTETLYYEASVTTWYNRGAPETQTMRSIDRELGP